MSENNAAVGGSVRKKSKKAPWVATAIMLSMGGLGAAYWYGYGQYYESTDNAYLAGEITNISSKVSGYIAKSYVSDNQRVKQGDLLAQIDSRDYQAALNQADAHLNVVKAGVQNLIAKQALQRTQIIQVQSHVDSAQAEYDRAAGQDARIRSLLKSKFTSQDEVDRVLAQQKVALAVLDEAKASLVASHEQMVVIASEITQAQASVAEAQAQREQALIDLGHTNIYAPIDGVIGKRAVRIGMLVQRGAQLMSLVSDAQVWIEANFKETQIGRIHKGQRVELTLDAYPGKVVAGVVDSFSPATGAKFALLPPENATGNFTKIVQRVPVKIVIDDERGLDAMLFPGLSVTATIDTRG
jgi:membrane fusion protein (multidrug efflux system)